MGREVVEDRQGVARIACPHLHDRQFIVFHAPSAYIGRESLNNPAVESQRDPLQVRLRVVETRHNLVLQFMDIDFIAAGGYREQAKERQPPKAKDVRPRMVVGSCNDEVLEVIAEPAPNRFDIRVKESDEIQSRDADGDLGVTEHEAACIEFVVDPGAFSAEAGSGEIGRLRGCDLDTRAAAEKRPRSRGDARLRLRLRARGAHYAAREADKEEQRAYRTNTSEAHAGGQRFRVGYYRPTIVRRKGSVRPASSCAFSRRRKEVKHPDRTIPRPGWREI